MFPKKCVTEERLIVAEVQYSSKYNNQLDNGFSVYFGPVLYLSQTPANLAFNEPLELTIPRPSYLHGHHPHKKMFYQLFYHPNFDGKWCDIRNFDNVELTAHKTALFFKLNTLSKYTICERSIETDMTSLINGTKEDQNKNWIKLIVSTGKNKDSLYFACWPHNHQYLQTLRNRADKHQLYLRESKPFDRTGNTYVHVVLPPNLYFADKTEDPKTLKFIVDPWPDNEAQNTLQCTVKADKPEMTEGLVSCYLGEITDDKVTSIGIDVQEAQKCYPENGIPSATTEYEDISGRTSFQQSRILLQEVPRLNNDPVITWFRNKEFGRSYLTEHDSKAYWTDEDNYYGWIANGITRIQNLIPVSTPCIVVAVIDTGIYSRHNIFNGRYIYKHGVDVDDSKGHGTVCAGIVSHFSPKNVKIVSMKVLSGNPEDIQTCIEEKFKNCLELLLSPTFAKVDIVSISIGFDWPPGICELLRQLVENKIVIFAAGNNANKETCTIMQSPYGINVGSCNYNGYRSEFSSRGDNLFCLAPGEEVPSAFRGTDDWYSLNTGTSFACPFVAAVAANTLARIFSLDDTCIPQSIEDRRTLMRNTVCMANILKQMCAPPSYGRCEAGPLKNFDWLSDHLWTSAEGYGVLQRWEILENTGRLREAVHTIFTKYNMFIRHNAI